jgi:hypothetical protein
MARQPELTFEIDYRNDRRLHRHRCRCCSKLLDNGQRALMVRLSGKTWAVHIACADKPMGQGGWTWRDAFEAWGGDHLRKTGWIIDRHPMSQPGAVKGAA